MRYKQDLAEFLPLADAAGLIQERAGIPEHEAREDIVAVLRDGDLEARWWSVIRGKFHRCYADDLPFGFLDNLTTDNIDWETSIARRRSVYVPFVAKIEVRRSDLDRLWPDRSPSAPNLTDKSRAKGGSKPKYNIGLQQFIDWLFAEFKSDGAHLTLVVLREWLVEKAPRDDGFDPEPEIPDCEDIEFYDNLVWWKDCQGQHKSISLRSLERYISRAKDRASRQAM